MNEKKLVKKIEGFQKRFNTLQYSLASLSERHNERLDMILGNKTIDNYQK